MSKPGEASVTDGDLLRSHRGTLLAAAGLGAIFVWLFWDFLSAQVRWAIRHQADWGHTLVIPIIAGYFVYLQRRRLLALAPFRTTWTGLIPVVLGVGWYTFCSLNPAARNHNLQAAGVWLTLAGVVLLFFGYRSMRYLWFPLIFLFIFGQSTSDRAMTLITFRMQDIATRGSHFVLVLMGIDVERAGNTLVIFDGQRNPHELNIAEACSGMRMLMAFLALGVALAYTSLQRFWQRAVLVVLAVPTAIFVNILRVVTLALLSLIDVDLAADSFHQLIGLIWLVPALFIYLGIVWIVRHLVDEPEDAPSSRTPPRRRTLPSPRPTERTTPLFDRRAKLAVLVVAVTLAVSGIGFRTAVARLNIYLRKQPVQLRQHLQTIPRTLGPWQAAGDDHLLDDATIESLGTDKYLNRRYVRTGGTPMPSLSLHVAYYTGMIDAVPHIPDRCFVAAGWDVVSPPENVSLDVAWPDATVHRDLVSASSGEPYRSVTTPHPVTGRPQTAYLPFGDVELRVSAFDRGAVGGRVLYGGYLFVSNQRTTPSPEVIRSLAFKPSERYAYFVKVQLATLLDEDEEPEQFTELAEDFVQHLMPHLMQCLPDWTVIEFAGTGEVEPDSRS